MIAVGTDPQDPQLDSSYANLPFTTLGDELPSQSCDFGDIDLNPSDIEQFLLQDFSLTFDSTLEGDVSGAAYPGSHMAPQSCDLTTFLFEDTPRPRDLNLSFPGDNHVQPLCPLQPVSFGSELPKTLVDDPGHATPPHSGGITPTNMSRSSSPAWSESSGNMSTSSVRSTTQDHQAARGNNPVPRHKRPSHKKAEIKRRDKIKTCLDDVKEEVPSLREKGKLSESTILSKAAEYIHHLKDGYTERGNKAAQLRREIECLSSEIHSFQDNLPAAGLKEEASTGMSLDDLYQRWVEEQSQRSNKFFIFSSITSKLFESFKELVGPAIGLSAVTAKSQEWQAKQLALPVLRKQILSGMLSLSRQNSIVMSSDKLRLDLGSETDSPMEDGHS